jgi:transposase InsO family protein
MTIDMDDSKITDIAGIKKFLKGTTGLKLKGLSRDEKYKWINQTLQKFFYFKLRKKEKALLKRYVQTITGYSDAQITRLIASKRRHGHIKVEHSARHRFSRRYTPEDMALLLETDNIHQRLSGPATKALLQRAFTVFGDQRYLRLKDISVAHLYNLRATKDYQRRALVLAKTRPVKNSIGNRKKPSPNGKPGYLRVDTVHQGDKDKAKGVYHINIVDEVTQWEIIGAVEGISEIFLEPLLETLLERFPFAISGFHSDNGGEFINDRVAQLLNKLLIEQTKSRSRRTNDNALVEGKNGSVIRKHMGYAHIPRRYATQINNFYMTHFNDYLNFHRPCGFATTLTDRKGKQKKIYETWQTPYERLKTLTKWEKHLKPTVTPEHLERIAVSQSDNDFAAQMLKAKEKLFSSVTTTEILRRAA